MKNKALLLSLLSAIVMLPACGGRNGCCGCDGKERKEKKQTKKITYNTKKSGFHNVKRA